jgi:multisubunit Na+/H+ antiporter MnhB subunit
MKLKKIIGAIALAAILICGIYAASAMYQSGPTYDGSKTDVVTLYENPKDYSTEEADGIADVIVKKNLDMTTAENVVYSIVFNFRGYDTMGESFILVAAVSGTVVIVRKVKKGKKEA